MHYLGGYAAIEYAGRFMNGELIPFKAEHWVEVSALPLVEAGMSAPKSLATIEMGRALEGNAWSFQLGGLIIACGGTQVIWPGRSAAWLYMTKLAVPYKHTILKKAKEVLAAAPKGRLECTACLDLHNQARWMRFLGFQLESPVLEKYGPFGEDHAGYVRFN